MEVLKEPFLPVIKRLGMNNVDESLHQLHVLKQEVEVDKDQLGVPEWGSV